MPCDVLVTGARGFVGSHVLARARARALDAVSADVDLRDRAATATLVGHTKPKAVIHLASAFGRGADAWSAVADDVAMTANIIATVRRFVPQSPVLVAGSAAQYGLAPAGLLAEGAPMEPLTPYGAAKCVVERLCVAEPLADGLRIVFTRSFNHVGPGQRPGAPVAAWAFQVAQAELGGGGVVNVGRLDVVRDFLDVRDVADAYLDLVATGTDGAGVVNVCSGLAVELSDVARCLVGLAEAPVELALDSALVRQLDPPAVVGDPSKLRRLTGFEPRYSLDQSLADVLDEWRAAVRDTAGTRAG